MNLLILGDLHGEFELLARMLALCLKRHLDLVLLTGDIGADTLPAVPPGARLRTAVYRGSLLAANEVLGALDTPVCYVPGNHDDPALSLPATNVHNVDLLARKEPVAVSGSVVWGVGGSTHTPGRFPYEYTDDRLARKLESVQPTEQAIVLTHCPPAETALGMTQGMQAAGSAALRRLVPPLAPKLWVCGHVHEATGLRIVDGVPVVNAGAFVMSTVATISDRPGERHLLPTMHAWTVESHDEWRDLQVARTILALDNRHVFPPYEWRLQQMRGGDWTIREG